MQLTQLSPPSPLRNRLLAKTPRKPVEVAVLAALLREVRPFLRRRHARRLQDPALPLWRFSLSEAQGLVALSGMGAAAAEQASRYLITHYQPKLLISCGFAGALTPALAPGDLVLAENLYCYDPVSHKLTLIPMTTSTSAPGSRLTALDKLPFFSGTLISTPAILPKRPHRPFLAHLPHPVLDLETAAVATVAAAHHLPVLALRAVTDGAEEEIPAFIAQAVADSRPPGFRQALAWLLADPTGLPTLLRFHRRAVLAARRLCQALEIIIPCVGRTPDA